MHMSATHTQDLAIMTPAPSKARLWTGRVLSALPIPLLLMGAVMKITNADAVREGNQHMGFPEHILPGIGVLELACTVLFLIPRTAFLGAILLTGYLGGAVVTHLRVGDPFYFPILFGVLIWSGLALRDPRLLTLLRLTK
jgi:hypothetical protein